MTWRYVSSQAEGIDTLTNVERIQFGDRTLALDISGNVNILHRTPDSGGFAYWVNALNNKLITRVAALV